MLLVSHTLEWASLQISQDGLPSAALEYFPNGRRFDHSIIGSIGTCSVSQGYQRLAIKLSSAQPSRSGAPVKPVAPLGILLGCSVECLS